MHGQTEFNAPLLNQYCVVFVLFVCLFGFCSFLFFCSFFFCSFFWWFLGVVVAVYLLFGWRFLIKIFIITKKGSKNVLTSLLNK